MSLSTLVEAFRQKLPAEILPNSGEIAEPDLRWGLRSINEPRLFLVLGLQIALAAIAAVHQLD